MYSYAPVHTRTRTSLGRHSTLRSMVSLHSIFTLTSFTHSLGIREIFTRLHSRRQLQSAAARPVPPPLRGRRCDHQRERRPDGGREARRPVRRKRRPVHDDDDVAHEIVRAQPRRQGVLISPVPEIVTDESVNRERRPPAPARPRQVTHILPENTLRVREHIERTLTAVELARLANKHSKRCFNIYSYIGSTCSSFWAKLLHTYTCL